MKTRKHNAGFTLVETLIAISILVLAVTGAYAAAQNGISSAILSKDQITAFYLAQEGVEYIRNLRDQNGLTGVNWLKGISEKDTDPCYFGNKCKVDAINQVVSACGSSCPNIKVNDNGFYAYDSGQDTKFNRVVELRLVNPHEVAVTVSVGWQKGLVSRNFVARENIFDWQ